MTRDPTSTAAAAVADATAARQGELTQNVRVKPDRASYQASYQDFHRTSYTQYAYSLNHIKDSASRLFTPRPIFSSLLPKFSS